MNANNIIVFEKKRKMLIFGQVNFAGQVDFYNLFVRCIEIKIDNSTTRQVMLCL